MAGVAAGALALATLTAAHAETPLVDTRADAAVDVATNVATGSGAATTLGTLTLAASGAEFDADGDIRIVAPPGWSFDTTAAITYSVTADGALRIDGATTGSVTAESAQTIVLDVTADSQAGDTLTLTGIRVVPDAATTASGNLGLSLDGDATVDNGPNDSADITALTIAAQVGSGFDRPLTDIGVNSAVWGGGSVAGLASATAAAGGVSATIFVDGRAVVYIPGAPAFVNAEFDAAYAAEVPAGTIVLVVR